jgi:uncharacterized FlaG/YvyC family protein
MAGEISILPGAATEVLPSPVAISPNRSGAPKGSTPQQKKSAESVPAGYPEDQAVLGSILKRAQNVALANNTTLSFERDDADGKIYIYIKDKRTGEELYRIPKKLAANIDFQHDQSHKVDVRI